MDSKLFFNFFSSLSHVADQHRYVHKEASAARQSGYIGIVCTLGQH